MPATGDRLVSRAWRAPTGCVMSDQFIDLAADRRALHRMLIEHGLAEAAESPAIEKLTGGVSSSILKVTTRRGIYCVKQALPKLKVAKDWFAPVTRVFAEIAWLEVAGRIVPQQVPKLIASDQDRGAFVMEYLPPEEYLNWKTELLAGRALEVGAAVGRLLGTLHRATARDAKLAESFRTDENFYALRLEAYLVETARQHPALASQLHALVTATQTHPFALVHGDVSPKNILLSPHGPLLLDAECAWYGDPAFDLAFLLNHLLLKAAFRPELATDYAQVFQDIVASYLPHVSWEPVAQFEARAAALLPGLMLARIDGKSPVEYLDELTRAHVRKVACTLIRAAEPTLVAVKARCVGAV